MTRTITVTVPMCPPSVLLPNRKRNEHWGKISKATHELREVARYAALGTCPTRWDTLTGPVVLDIYVGYGRRRRLPDLDGSAGACKAAIDAMADAGIILDDRQLDELRVRHGKDPSGDGFIRITITEVEA